MRSIQSIYPSWIISLFVLFLSGCIEQYYPDKDELKPGTLFVLAHLTGKPGLQSIHISRSSAIVYPEYNPLSACLVSVENHKGESREFSELEPGHYRSNLDQDFLKTGSAYRLEVITPNGTMYESDFEPLLPVPEIESLYYVREDHATRDPNIIEEGVQF
ncbi:MAG: DUF4249 family protein, partial [Bacteroidales bacterium]|nr:DUF4249 family protein [Bacteroidales bacterium]